MTYYCVETSFDDKGMVNAAIVESVEAKEKPEGGFVSTPRKDIYTDWFDSLDEAKDFVDQAGRA